jgi:hypothetical protein
VKFRAIGLLALFLAGPLFAESTVDELVEQARAYEKWISTPVGLQQTEIRMAQAFQNRVAMDVLHHAGNTYGEYKDCNHPAYRHGGPEKMLLAVSGYLISNSNQLRSKPTVGAALLESLLATSLLCER